MSNISNREQDDSAKQPPFVRDQAPEIPGNHPEYGDGLSYCLPLSLAQEIEREFGLESLDTSNWRVEIALSRHSVAPIVGFWAGWPVPFHLLGHNATQINS